MKSIKNHINLFVPVFLFAVLFTSVSGCAFIDKALGLREPRPETTADMTETASETFTVDSGQTQNMNTSPYGYWKAVRYGGEGVDADEFWSDLFLWEDGTGYFRFSQASEESNYYGFRNVFDCSWILKDGLLVLTNPQAPSTVLYTGTFQQDRLTIAYDGFFHEILQSSWNGLICLSTVHNGSCPNCTAHGGWYLIPTLTGISPWMNRIGKSILK